MAPEPLSLPMLLTVRETAELLRTSDKAIYAMVERAQLPGVTRVGRRVLIRSSELLRWLDHNKRTIARHPDQTLGGAADSITNAEAAQVNAIRRPLHAQAGRTRERQICESR